MYEIGDGNRHLILVKELTFSNCLPSSNDINRHVFWYPPPVLRSLNFDVKHLVGSSSCFFGLRVAMVLVRFTNLIYAIFCPSPTTCFFYQFALGYPLIWSIPNKFRVNFIVRVSFPSHSCPSAFTRYLYWYPLPLSFCPSAHPNRLMFSFDRVTAIPISSLSCLWPFGSN